jgi:hypothetical protein
MAIEVASPCATRTWREQFTADGDSVVEKVQKLIHEGNVRHIVVEHDGQVIFELPLTVGVVAALLQPQIAGLAAVAALVTSCTITVERDEPWAGGPRGLPPLDAD